MQHHCLWLKPSQRLRHWPGYLFINLNILLLLLSSFLLLQEPLPENEIAWTQARGQLDPTTVLTADSMNFSDCAYLAWQSVSDQLFPLPKLQLHQFSISTQVLHFFPCRFYCPYHEQSAPVVLLLPCGCSSGQGLSEWSECPDQKKLSGADALRWCLRSRFS